MFDTFVQRKSKSLRREVKNKKSTSLILASCAVGKYSSLWDWVWCKYLPFVTRIQEHESRRTEVPPVTAVRLILLSLSRDYMVEAATRVALTKTVHMECTVQIRLIISILHEISIIAISSLPVYCIVYFLVLIDAQPNYIDS